MLVETDVALVSDEALDGGDIESALELESLDIEF